MAAWAVALLLLLPGLGGDLEGALARSGIDRAGLGVAIGRAGEAPLLVVHADTPRVPASNQKLVTAAAALQVLGADFRFETRIGTSAEGDLVVVGGGDPNLSGRLFDGDPNRLPRLMARDVAESGVDRVAGDLVLDASRFDDVHVHPDWPDDQLDRWYCAPVAALVFNDSCWDVTVRPGGAPGAAASVVIQPALVRPPLVNECRTIAGGRQVVHIGRAGGGGLLVRGRILERSGGITGHVTVRDPVRFFGEVFRAALAEQGIGVAGRLRAGTAPLERTLARYHTSLERTLRTTLTSSQNLYAECVFKRLGDGTFEGGARAVAGALERLGVPTAGLAVSDGSGLARTDGVTPRTLYALLQALRDDAIFRDALAGGGEGTLRRRYRSLGERLQAKTGSIAGVSALSGYVVGREGGLYVFTLLANGRSKRHARRLQDLVVQVLERAP